MQADEDMKARLIPPEEHPHFDKEQHSKVKFKNKYLIIVVVFTTFGGFMFGYNTSVIAGAQLYLDETFPDITTIQTGTIVSAAILGAAVGSLFSGPFSDKLGLIPTIIAADLFFGAGALLSASAHSINSLIVYRFISGVGEGVSSMATPIYLSQMSPNSIRGGLVSSTILCVTTGQVVSYVVCLLLGNNWRLMLGAVVVPAAVQLLGAMLLPEPPVVLLSQGKEERAMEVLGKIYWEEDIPVVMEELQEEVEVLKMQKGIPYARQLTQLFGIYKYSLAVGIGLQAFQQMAGINTIMYFGPALLQKAGFGHNSSSSDQTAILFALPLATINALGSLWAVFFLDRVGRRAILLFIQFPMAGALLTLAAGLGIQNWAGEQWLDVAKWLCFAAIVVYSIFFSTGFGPTPWAVNSEIFPLHLRGAGNSISTCSNWTSNFLLSQLFLSASSTPLGEVLTFSFIAFVCVMAFCFVYFLLPETKGKPIEENVCAVNRIERPKKEYSFEKAA